MESTSLSCGIIMPISAMDGYLAKHWEEIQAIYIDVAQKCGLSNAKLVSEEKSSGVIHTNIIKNLFENDIVICDVSGKNPNVMFELGLRIAFDKPVIVTKDDETKISFDIAPLKYLEYPKTQHHGGIEKFKIDLTECLQATLEKSPSYLQSFGINYSRVDNSEAFLQKLSSIEKDVRLTKILTLQNQSNLSNLNDLIPFDPVARLNRKLGIKS
ncbi:hypothetical protein FA592_11785 [Sulfurospirillum diekertiae]|uniref:Nucleoside 2-deoxyribosyltransferase n=1 Tax=Sulfurospirillum diekertiae TaxID=1854492 RepID=A0A290HV36_9BACT|nr:hypothetical protein [Sulfurospirillum diekertiae]ATB69229.1 hypothetical protein SJPD1_1117 [Sulfurospirillum diekertiae]QIR76878.1 hypothetical protein FA584_11995 [Sulfurospirillum diekertiae]QIR79496.1 hypothetical protein FA592_11785 [Sulfurospirillum diekertiae]